MALKKVWSWEAYIPDDPDSPRHGPKFNTEKERDTALENFRSTPTDKKCSEIIGVDDEVIPGGPYHQ